MCPMKPPYKPFTSGGEFYRWNCNNCEKCTKGPAADQDGINEKCDIENAFVLASLCGGTIVDECIGDLKNAENIATRLGWDGMIGTLPGRCNEYEQK